MIEFLPKLAECLNCEINGFFIPIAEASFDIDMLKEFSEFMTEHIIQSKKCKGFMPLHFLLLLYMILFQKFNLIKPFCLS